MATRSRMSVRGDTLFAGVVAWLALNAFTYAAAPLFRISVDEVGRFFGSLLLPASEAGPQLWAGRALFLVAALAWSFVYRWARTYLPGPGWLRGLLFGTGIWLVSALLLPLLGAMHPLNGPGGAFSAGGAPFPGLFGLGFDGGAGVALSILAHLVFGVVLGTLLGTGTSASEART